MRYEAWMVAYRIPRREAGPRLEPPAGEAAPAPQPAEPPPAPPPFALRAWALKRSWATWPLERRDYVVGRLNDRMTIDLVFGKDAPNVSRKHARLNWRVDRHGTGAFHLRDLGSLHGTFLNSERLGFGAEAEVRHGDVIWLGRACSMAFSAKGMAGLEGARGPMAFRVAAAGEPAAGEPAPELAEAECDSAPEDAGAGEEERPWAWEETPPQQPPRPDSAEQPPEPAHRAEPHPHGSRGPAEGEAPPSHPPAAAHALLPREACAQQLNTLGARPRPESRFGERAQPPAPRPPAEARPRSPPPARSRSPLDARAPRRAQAQAAPSHRWTGRREPLRSPSPRRERRLSPSPRRVPQRSQSPRRVPQRSPSPRRVPLRSPSPRRVLQRSQSPRRQWRRMPSPWREPPQARPPQREWQRSVSPRRERSASLRRQRRWEPSRSPLPGHARQRSPRLPARNSWPLPALGAQPPAPLPPRAHVRLRSRSRSPSPPAKRRALPAARHSPPREHLWAAASLSPARPDCSQSPPERTRSRSASPSVQAGPPRAGVRYTILLAAGKRRERAAREAAQRVEAASLTTTPTRSSAS